MKKFLIYGDKMAFTLWATPDMLPVLEQQFGKGKVEEVRDSSITAMVTDYVMFAKPQSCIEWANKASQNRAVKLGFSTHQIAVGMDVADWLACRVHTDKVADAIISYVGDGAAEQWLADQRMKGDNDG